MHTLTQSVLAYIQKHALLKAGDRLGAAVSGGADSVAMLRLLIELRGELGIVLSVVHFNHKLRGAESDEDERFVADLARQHKLEFFCESGDVRAHATAKRRSVEAAARDLRYEFFRRLLLAGRVNRIATAHTLDDQAETVLLRVVRGAGTRGLAGIYPELSIRSQGSGVGSQLANVSIIRPLLGSSRKDLEAYLAALDQSWREDASNRDLRHARNRIRHGILPRLERHLNPSVRETLSETADIARAEEEYWLREIERVLPLILADRPAALKLKSLAELPLALQRRIVRGLAESLGLRLEFRLVEKILAGKPAELPGGWFESRNERELWFERTKSREPRDYEYSLPVPGQVEVRETGSCFEARLVSADAQGYNPEDFLDQALLRGDLRVRNWRAGDRFWPAHTKAPKKVKELLQERHLTGDERTLWPVVASRDELVWVRGFAAPTHLRAKDGSKATLVIRELRSNQDQL